MLEDIEPELLVELTQPAALAFILSVHLQQIVLASRFERRPNQSRTMAAALMIGMNTK
ncbi:hypothetical protein MAHJHV45_48120 [Mycobacterium avium subsp. hominissuis]|nr:hypothetical protein O982_24865 [Mycobacterium avium 10-5581]